MVYYMVNYIVNYSLKEGSTMGMVIRVLYNNQGWKSPCVRPGTDNLCQKCFSETNIDIRVPHRDDEVCSGWCWERDICTRYEWGCTPKGRRFGLRATEGAKVYMVFQQPDKKYTLWGVTEITAVNVPPSRELIEHEKDYKQWIRFVHFDPLPTEYWVRNLTDYALVGEQWRQGRHRYISEEKESELDDRISGIAPQKPSLVLASSSISRNGVMKIDFAPIINDRLIEISNAEGRQPGDIVKEAVAEWLRDRGSLS